MVLSPATQPRTLFVVDNDFGALGTVVYLLHRQAVAEQAVVMLPPDAHARHAPGLPFRSAPYRHAADIVAAAREHQAEVVCLYSGYLMSFQGLLTERGLRRLVATLRQEGRRVTTSDPYLGTFPLVMDTEVPGRRRALEHLLQRPPLSRLPGARLLASVARGHESRNWRRRIRDVAEALSDCVHIYPVPLVASAVPHASFFNPEYLRASPERSASPPGSRPRWLFVLAQFDLLHLDRTLGRATFTTRLAARLREAVDQGRDAVFIGPESICNKLGATMGGTAVTLLPGCSFAEFERRLFDAEAAFYWQIFSTSAFMRMWSGLPVFAFDRGHNAQLLKPLHDAGLARYYVASAPHFLDFGAPLDAAQIVGSRPVFEEEARAACGVLERLPRPAEMLARLAPPRPESPTVASSLRSPAPPPAG